MHQWFDKVYSLYEQSLEQCATIGAALSGYHRLKSCLTYLMASAKLAKLAAIAIAE